MIRHVGYFHRVVSIQGYTPLYSILIILYTTLQSHTGGLAAIPACYLRKRGYITARTWTRTSDVGTDMTTPPDL
jgi:hypothetical protein